MLEPDELTQIERRVREAIVLGPVNNIKHWMYDGRAMLSYTPTLRLAAKAIVELLPTEGIDVLATMGVGGMALATAVQMLYPGRTALTMIRKTLYTRLPSGCPPHRWVEGAPIKPGARIWIIDDSSNKGRTYPRIKDRILAAYPGAIIAGMAVLVDYEKGSTILRMNGIDVRAHINRKTLMRLVRERRAAK